MIDSTGCARTSIRTPSDENGRVDHIGMVSVVTRTRPARLYRSSEQIGSSHFHCTQSHACRTGPMRLASASAIGCRYVSGQRDASQVVTHHRSHQSHCRDSSQRSAHADQPTRDQRLSILSTDSAHCASISAFSPASCIARARRHTARHPTAATTTHTLRVVLGVHWQMCCEASKS